MAFDQKNSRRPPPQNRPTFTRDGGVLRILCYMYILSILSYSLYYIAFWRLLESTGATWVEIYISQRSELQWGQTSKAQIDIPLKRLKSLVFRRIVCCEFNWKYPTMSSSKLPLCLLVVQLPPVWIGPFSSLVFSWWISGCFSQKNKLTIKSLKVASVTFIAWM